LAVSAFDHITTHQLTKNHPCPNQTSPSDPSSRLPD
jgi:hypothetical protein